MSMQSENIIYRFKDFLRERYPFPVRKLGIHTRLGCPHRNGRHGGCVYCYNPGFSSIEDAEATVVDQLRVGIDTARGRGFEGRFIAYFQTETNTYGNIEQLREWWTAIDAYSDDIVGLSVGTRPDCIDTDVLMLLAEMAERYMVWLELGLQSSHDNTLQLINRGHDYACFLDAVKLTRQLPNILLCAHIILNLPGETVQDMRHTIREINRLELDGVKFHHLQVVEHTLLAEWYRNGQVQVLTAEEYISLLVELLPELSPSVVVHRLVGDIRDDLLIAPRWDIPKGRVIQLVEQEMFAKDLKQGSGLGKVGI